MKSEAGLLVYRAANHRRRSRLLGGLSAKEIGRLLAEARGRCFYCRNAAKLEIDHVIPISRGGPHAIGNLVASCRPCNMKKGNRMPSEWLSFRTRLEL
jgi:5-methylcytosine-specific restriction endonuclease McrA